MTGMIVLDVVIGLIFIYLFYSLFCTVIIEIIATNLGLRARNLKIAIVRLLSDGKVNWRAALSTFWKSNYFPKEKSSPIEIGGKPIESESLAESFYGSSIIKNLGYDWWFSKPAWIGNETFIDAIISILARNKPDETALALRVKDFFENPPKTLNETETFKRLKFYFDKSNGDLDRFRENLSLWYDEIGERATGWYKKRIQVILFGVGLAIATGFNVDTIQIATKLSQDEDARRYFIEVSDKIINDSTSSPELIERAKARKEAALDSMITESFEIQSVLSLERCKEDPKNKSECKECSGWDKYFFSSPANFLGCLITAFAISLGSPFWFDLLNKFMQLRGSIGAGATNEKKVVSKTSNGEPIKG